MLPEIKTGRRKGLEFFLIVRILELSFEISFEKFWITNFSLGKNKKRDEFFGKTITGKYSEQNDRVIKHLREKGKYFLVNESEVRI